jgi:hypothetical protein
MPQYEVTLYGTKEVEVNYTAVVRVEADNEDDAGEKAHDAEKKWEMDDDQPSISRTTRVDSFYANQVDEVK